MENEVNNFRTVGMAPLNEFTFRPASEANAVMPPSSVGMLELSLLNMRRPKLPPSVTPVMRPSSVGTDEVKVFLPRFK